jgi:hypothetical protein
VNLGVQFRPRQREIIGVRFYKTRQHGHAPGSLDLGTLLATGTFSRAASGWRNGLPPGDDHGRTTVASYHTNAGHYAITSNGLTRRSGTGR